MRVTKSFLKEQQACREGFAWFSENTTGEVEHAHILNQLLATGHWDWFRWLAVRLMTKAQKIEWAIFCAEAVLDIFEKKFPDDARPRNAIAATKAMLKDPSAENKCAAASAAYAAYAAADAAYAAYAAASAAYAAAYAACAAYDAAYVSVAACAYDAARISILKECADLIRKSIEMPRWDKRIKSS